MQSKQEKEKDLRRLPIVMIEQPSPLSQKESATGHYSIIVSNRVIIEEVMLRRQFLGGRAKRRKGAFKHEKSLRLGGERISTAEA